MKSTVLRPRQKKAASKRVPKGGARHRPKLTLDELRDLQRHFDLAGWNANAKNDANSRKAAGA